MEVRHAAVRSISIRLAEDRQKILTGESKFCFSRPSCCLHFTMSMFTDSDTESGSESVVLRSVYTSCSCPSISTICTPMSISI